MSAETERQLKTTELTLGMYVSRLDRPWLEAPITFKGFTIKQQADIDLLQRSCQYVYVDLERGDCPAEIPACRPAPTTAKPKAEQTLDDIARHPGKGNDTPTLAAHQRAQAAYQAMETMFDRILADVDAGEPLHIAIIGKQLMGMIASVKHNADSMLQLLLLDRARAFPAQDAMTTSVLATALGHGLGMDNKALYQLAIGGLLYDVGKLELPLELLNEPRPFSAAEFRVVKRHVDSGVRILRQAQGITKPILEMAQHHHERYDGSGYPAGLARKAVPLVARIAGIVDCFNAITRRRAHAPTLSPYHAALKLYEWRKRDFDPRLVEKLIQVIGVYPIGTPIELSDGGIAVVVAHNRARRLQPVVAVLLDQDKQTLAKPIIIDLSRDQHIYIKQAVAAQQYPLPLDGLIRRLY